LSQSLGTSVQIRSGRKGAGKLVISFTSPDHLEDLLSKINR